MANDVGAAREADFKARLKKYFPDRKRIKLAYTPLQMDKDTLDPTGEDAYCFGYDTQEYVLLGKKSSSFGWIPHVRNLTDELIDILVEDLKKDLTTKQK